MKNLLTSLDIIFVIYSNFGENNLTGIFGTGSVLRTDINLILQIVMFLIIAISLVYKNKMKFKIHGGLMAIAVILNIASLLAVMGPSFSAGYEYFTTATSDLGVQTIWIHAILGAIALILGIFLVGAWTLRPSKVAACSRRKRIMDVTVLLWLVSLIFGIASYIAFYV
jgi:uncharacterized membrane protein YozB (DUF420 family)